MSVCRTHAPRPVRRGSAANDHVSGARRAAATSAVRRPSRPRFARRRYPVDPAGSHMLVLRAKPCTSKYERLEQRNCEWLITSAIIHLAVILDGYPQEFWG